MAASIRTGAAGRFFCSTWQSPLDSGLGRADHHRARVSTLTFIPHHHARLIHLWRPTGKPEFEKEDVLQVMFITCDIMRDGAPQ